jgi:hypothetical protein
MPYVKGFLRVVSGRPDNSLPGVEGPVDPDYGIGIEHPDQGLPSVPGPVDPGYGVPLPPVVSHPMPPHPDQGLPGTPPTYPVDPDYGLPAPPTVWPQPPRPVDPGYGVPIPIGPEHPIYYPPVGPNHDLPIPPGAVWPPLPPYIDNGLPGSTQVMCFVWIPGIGYRWTTLDLSLKPTHPMVPPSTVPQPPSDLAPTHPIAPGGGTPTHPIDPGGQPTPRR